MLTLERHDRHRVRVARALPPEARERLSRRIGPGWAAGMEIAMDKIVQANIHRFNLLLETEADPTKRAMIIRLLAEEKMKLETKPAAKEA
jgi:hypothetical protein